MTILFFIVFIVAGSYLCYWMVREGDNVRDQQKEDYYNQFNKN